MKIGDIEEDLLSIFHNIKPYVPFFVGLQLLSSKLEDIESVKANKLLSFLLLKKYSLVTSVAMSAAFLYWMRKSTIDDIKEEAKKFSFIEKEKTIEHPFVVENIDGSRKNFFHVDKIAEFIGSLYVGKTSDLAARSFVAAKRTVVLGWVDVYALRTAEFIAIRSLEQLLHDRYPDTRCVKNNKITGIGISKVSLFEDDATTAYLNGKFGTCFNIGKTIEEIIEIRDNFAHRDDPGFEYSPLRLAPFQLVSALLEYRGSKQ